MSRIGILTFLHNGNFGSSLQAYALQRVIREMGHDCEHIDYQPDFREKTVNMLRCGNSPKLLLEGRKKRYVLSSQKGMQIKKCAIDVFYSRRMRLSALCKNCQELGQLSENYDILLCGSDQIWNPVWMNPAYFLDFGNPEKIRVAYAASLGISTSPGRRKSRMIRRMTSLFDAISVREEEGARLMVTITGNRPPVRPDPVCLLGCDDWKELAEPLLKREPYLLCYFIGENKNYWQHVQEIERETGLHPLVIPVTSESYEQDYDLLDGAGPEGYLGAIAGAEMICTDSFHGLAFGHLFGKQTDLIRRYQEGDPESKNSRVDHFLREIRQKGLPLMLPEGLRWLEELLNRK